MGTAQAAVSKLQLKSLAKLNLRRTAQSSHCWTVLDAAVRPVIPDFGCAELADCGTKTSFAVAAIAGAAFVRMCSALSFAAPRSVPNQSFGGPHLTEFDTVLKIQS